MRSLRNTLAALALLGVATAAGAPAALAKTNYQDVIRECYNTGQLTPGKYSRHDLKEARQHLPADIKEYSDCEDLINAALAAAGRQGGGGGYTPPGNPAFQTPSGAIASSKDDLNALDRATKAPRPTVDVAGSKLSPSTGDVINAAKNSDANSLPLPLLASLIALAAMAVLGGASVLRGRWPQIRRAPLRLLGR